MKYLLILFSSSLYAGGVCSSKPSILQPIAAEQILVQQAPVMQPHHRLAHSAHTRLDSTDQQEQNRVVAVHIRPEPVERIENKNEQRRPARSPSSERRRDQYRLSHDVTREVLERNAELAVKRIKSEGQWTFTPTLMQSGDSQPGRPD